MKKRLNNKGFTLIETVITFAIVAVVGGMFILGFSNVIHLMTDAELIKNDTNELYSDVLSDTDVNVQDQKVKLKIDGQDYEETVKVSSKTINDGSTVIKLSKFATSTGVSWLPSNAQGSESGGNNGGSGNIGDPNGSTVDDETVPARFRLVKQIDGNFPKDLNTVKTYDNNNQGWYFDFKNTFTIRGALSSQATSMYDLNGTIEQYVKIAPSQIQLKTVDINYKNQLGNGDYKVFWFAIDRDTDIPTVYGIIYPSGYNRILINICSWKINSAVFIPIEGTAMNEQYASYIRDYSGTININGNEYTKSQISRYSFIDNNTDIYFAKDD